MKKIINILSVSVFVFVFAISFSSVASAQQVCFTSSGQQGVMTGGICISTAANGYTQCPNGTQVPPGYPCAGGTGGTFQTGYQGQVGQSDLSFFQNLIGSTGSIVHELPPILIGAAVVVFFYYLIRYLIANKDPDEKKKHLKGMMYSLLAIFVMVCLWGIIYFVASTLDINIGGSVPAPQLPY